MATSHESHRSHFFIFVNSASGGGLGHKLLSQQVEELCLRLTTPSHPIRVYIYSLRQNRKRGFAKLKKVVQSGKKAVAVICGGDGTVTWVVQQLANNDIDTDLVPIAIVPVGTGNDFSQELGWGTHQNSLVENGYQTLKELIKEWCEAREQYFDIWEIQAQVYEKGKFERVQNRQNSKLQTRKICKPFCNYFSFGMDGKVGYSFDMHRTETRLGNLAMYGILGLFKSMTKTKTLSDLVSTMQIRNDLSDQIPKQSKLVFHGLTKSGLGKEFTTDLNQQAQSKVISKVLDYTQQQINPITSQQKTTLESKQWSPIKQKMLQQANSTSKVQQLQTEDLTNSLKLQKKYCNLVALNINSFMGGVKDIWINASSVNVQSTMMQELRPPSTSDGKLQFVSFATCVGLGSERVFAGQADKITQGTGPYCINFKEYPQEQKHRTYLQVDGEFFRFTHPKSILIRKSRMVHNGKIKVLRKRQRLN